MRHIGYENNCTCPPCLKKYSRWQKAILKIELQECFAELKKAKKTVDLENNNEAINDIDKNIKDCLREENKSNPHARHLLPKIHPECDHCIKQL